jgi:hypothetical protein
MPITVDVSHEAAYGELRIHNIQIALPIGDHFAAPYIVEALEEYIEKLNDHEVGDKAHEAFVSSKGCVVTINHSFPASDYAEALAIQGA